MWNATETDLDRRSQEQYWIQRCLDGDSGAFQPLIQRYERMVRTLIYRLINTMHEVDDLAQETFMTAYQNLSQYGGQSRFSTWLCQIALNKARDALRVHRRREEVDIDDLELASEADGPEDWIAERQRSEQLQSALDRLRPQDRESIVLKHLMELSYEELAQMSACTVQAAKVRTHRAREELKKVLEKMGFSL